MTDRPAPPARKTRATAVAAFAALAALAAAGVVYATVGGGKAPSAACKGTGAAVARLDPLVRGEVAALNLAQAPRPLPALAFDGPDGKRLTLADFKGRTVLLNLWATWCVPCRKEMPALDRLQAAQGGPGFAVVAVNIDTARLDRPKTFLQDTGVTHLPLYADPTAAVFQALRTEGKALGLPTTMLVDPEGCEIGTMAGPAEWDSSDAQKLIEAAKAAAVPQG